MTINSSNNPMLKLVEDALYLYKFNIKIENVFPSNHHTVFRLNEQGNTFNHVINKPFDELGFTDIIDSIVKKKKLENNTDAVYPSIKIKNMEYSIYKSLETEVHHRENFKIESRIIGLNETNGSIEFELVHEEFYKQNEFIYKNDNLITDHNNIKKDYTNEALFNKLSLLFETTFDLFGK